MTRTYTEEEIRAALRVAFAETDGVPVSLAKKTDQELYSLLMRFSKLSKLREFGEQAFPLMEALERAAASRNMKVPGLFRVVRNTPEFIRMSDDEFAALTEFSTNA